MAVKWAPTSGVQWQNADPACAISSASGKRQPMTTQIRNCRFTKIALDLNTGSGNLTEVNKTVALIGHCAYANWKYNALSHRIGEVDAHLSRTDSSPDSGAASINTPPAPLSVPIAAHRCRAPLCYYIRYYKSN